MHPALRHSLRWLRRSLWLAAAGLLLVVGVNFWMTRRSADRIQQKPDDVPTADVALVLGTGKLTKWGGLNGHFRIRMDAAAELYKAGRVRHLLLSGDNSHDGYNEPEDMKQALLDRGVPAAAMTCDYAGFRTLDSVVRAKDIFGVTKCIIISDDFHLARALWLADRNGIAATAYFSEARSWGNSWKARSREWFARVLAVGDELIGTEPKFGGSKIPLPIADAATSPPPAAPVALPVNSP